MDRNGIAFQWTFEGTNTGPWSDGTKATGKHFSFHGLTLVRVKGGKIAYQGDYYDAYGFFKQLGLAQ
jgi:ketosteroid isomerase-like protein